MTKLYEYSLKMSSHALKTNIINRANLEFRFHLSKRNTNILKTKNIQNIDETSVIT